MGKAGGRNNVHTGICGASWSPSCLCSPSVLVGHCCIPPHSHSQTLSDCPTLVSHPSLLGAEDLSIVVHWTMENLVRLFGACLPNNASASSHEARDAGSFLPLHRQRTPSPMAEDTDPLCSWIFQLQPWFLGHPLP